MIDGILSDGFAGAGTRKLLLICSASLMVSAMHAGFAEAQISQASAGSSSPTGSGPNASSVAEVVVTAERREGTVQSTPLSITAVSGAQLQAEGITDISQLGYETPGVSQRNAGPGQTEYEIRGISSGGGSSPTIGFYLDDVPLTSPAQSLQGKVVIDPNLYDLNRVEILRGPQGTLYGASSEGGTIRLITNQPNTKAFGASGEVIGSGTQDGGGNYTLNLMTNIPLVEDKLALRIVGTESYTSGWIDRIVLNPFPVETNGGQTRGNVLAAPVQQDHKDSNWERLGGVRAALLWQPINNLTITPTAFYQKITQGGVNYIDQPPGVSYEAHYQPFNVPEPYSDSFSLFTLPINYQFNGVAISSITGYYRRQSILTQDASEVAQDFLQAIIGIPDVSYDAAGALTAYEVDHSSQFTQEIRLSSTGAGAFQWLVGGFYQDFDAKTSIGTGMPGPLVAELFSVPSYFTLFYDNTIKQYAGFGEASYRYGPFKFTAGVRYFSYKTGEHITESGGLITGLAPPLHFTLPSSASGYDPKFNLSYEPTRDLTFYTQAAKGLRPGNGNTPPSLGCQPFGLQYNPDSLWSYEAGEKARFLNNRITVNSAIYHEDWTGIQQLVTQTCGDQYTANAGTAHINGGELEGTVRLLPGLTVSTGFSYTHAELVSVLPGTGFTAGERVQDVPEVTDTTSVTYNRPVTNTYNLVLRATDEYTGTMIDPSYQINHLPARHIVNLRAALVGNNRLSVSLFANNIGDKRAYIDDPAEIFTFVPSINRAATNQPRTVGIDISYALGAH